MKRQSRSATRKNQYLVLIIFLLAGLMMFGFGQVSSAQIIRTKPQVKTTPTPQVRRTPPNTKDVIVFKGTDIRDLESVVNRSREFSTPPTLTKPDIKSMLADVLSSEGGNNSAPNVIPYAVLSVRTPYFENKAQLDFQDVAETDLSMNYALFTDSNTKQGFSVAFQAKKGQSFLVDCSFGTGQGKGVALIITGGNNVVEKVASPYQNIRLALVLVDRDGFYRFHYRAKTPMYWWLKSCEVSRLEF
jgi:hypothetical protein